MTFKGQNLDLTPQKSWQKAREICQKFCMDLITIDSLKEDQLVKDIIVRNKVYGVWTGGQVCQDKGCMLGKRKTTWVWEPNKRFIKHER